MPQLSQKDHLKWARKTEMSCREAAIFDAFFYLSCFCSLCFPYILCDYSRCNYVIMMRRHGKKKRHKIGTFMLLLHSSQMLPFNTPHTCTLTLLCWFQRQFMWLLLPSVTSLAYFSIPLVSLSLSQSLLLSLLWVPLCALAEGWNM